MSRLHLLDGSFRYSKLTDYGASRFGLRTQLALRGRESLSIGTLTVNLLLLGTFTNPSIASHSSSCICFSRPRSVSFVAFIHALRSLSRTAALRAVSSGLWVQDGQTVANPGLPGNRSNSAPHFEQVLIISPVD